MESSVRKKLTPKNPEYIYLFNDTTDNVIGDMAKSDSPLHPSFTHHHYFINYISFIFLKLNDRSL